MKTRFVILLMVAILVSLLSGTTLMAATEHLQPVSKGTLESSRGDTTIGVLIEFDLSSIPDSATIDAAELKIKVDAGRGEEEHTVVLITPISAGWTDGMATSTRPTVSEDEVYASTQSTGSGQAWDFNLTPLVIRWKTGEIENHGILVTIIEDVEELISLAPREGQQAIEAELVVRYTNLVPVEREN